MSTYLELCQALRQECGISGSGPVSVVNQTGEMKRVCDWIVRAWIDIQEENPDWSWMRKSVTFDTVAQQSNYSYLNYMALLDFASWRNNSFRAYLKSAGVMNEIRLTQWEYSAFRDYYLLGARRVTYSRPVNWAIDPDKNIELGLIPDDVYTVTGEYYSTPVVLTANGDTPDMPARFHNAIMYRAMMFYGAYEDAPAVYQSAEKEYRRMMNKLRIDQAPMITMAGSMIR